MARKTVPPPASEAPAALPKSLEGHVILPDRLSMIAPHVAMLAATALAVGNELPLQADIGDYVRVLDQEAR